jgi:DNA-binding response OmpR family regulator
MEVTPGALAGIHVAIVEDDAMLLDSLALFLRVKGCRVETFRSAEEAGDAGKLGGFGIVISDFRLPGEDGLSLLRRVRQASKTAITVLVTAYGNKDFPERMERAGIDGYISKPFSTEELESTLLRLTAKGRCGGHTALEATS